LELEVNFLYDNEDVIKEYCKEYLEIIPEMLHIEKFFEVLVLQTMTGNQPVLENYGEIMTFSPEDLKKLRVHEFHSVGELLGRRLWDIVKELL